MVNCCPSTSWRTQKEVTLLIATRVAVGKNTSWLLVCAWKIPPKTTVLWLAMVPHWPRSWHAWLHTNVPSPSRRMSCPNVTAEASRLMRLHAVSVIIANSNRVCPMTWRLAPFVLRIAYCVLRVQQATVHRPLITDYRLLTTDYRLPPIPHDFPGQNSFNLLHEL